MLCLLLHRLFGSPLLLLLLLLVPLLGSVSTGLSFASRTASVVPIPRLVVSAAQTSAWVGPLKAGFAADDVNTTPAVAACCLLLLRCANQQLQGTRGDLHMH
jgi:hypothetical protein